MKNFDKEKMIADFLAEMNAPDVVEEPVETTFASELSQSLSDDIHRDILAITNRIVSNAAHSKDLQVVDSGIESLIESLTIIAKSYAETDEEIDMMVKGYIELLQANL